MTLSSVLKNVERFTIDNSPSLLTAVGVVGTISTAILTHRAAIKTERSIKDVEADEQRYLDRREAFNLVWTHYIPPVATGVLTIACVVGANQVGGRRAAVAAAAYSISERSFEEYRSKVVEKMGDKPERALRDEIAQDRINDNPMHEGNLVVVGGGDVLCYEMYTGRYFRSSVETLKKAVNEVNFEINANNYACLTDFYNHINIPKTEISDDVGWNSDKLMDIDIHGVVADDGQPAVAFSYSVEPLRRYHRLH